MSDLATQRDQWDGHPVELGDAWTLRKGQRLARCALVSNPFGWELRPMAGELVRSQVCRTQDETRHAGEPEGGDGGAGVALSA